MKKIPLLVATIKTLWRMISPSFRRELDSIARVLTLGHTTSPNNKVFYLMVGFSKSGKHATIGLVPELRHSFRISSNVIHNVLNLRFTYLQDDKTITGRAYWERQILAQLIRDMVMRRVLYSGVDIVQDSCNLSRPERANRLRLAKRHGYRTVIVWVKCDPDTLMSRLKIADEENIRRGQEPTWVKLYLEVQLPRYDPPKQGEADALTSSSNNGDPIVLIGPSL